MSVLRRVVFVAALAPLAAVQAAEGDSGAVTWSLETGLGYDSNVFETNDQAYTDYWILKVGGTPAQAAIDPIVKSGWFIPYAGEVYYGASATSENIFRVGVELDGEKYLGSDIADADQYEFLGVLDDTMILSSNDKGENSLQFRLYFGKVQKIYYDHDEGEDKLTTLGGVNVSDRYKHNKQGLEINWEHSLTPVLYKVSLDLQQRDYMDAVAVSQLDSSITDLTGSAKFPLGKSTKMRVGYGYKNRDYSDRKAKDLDGTVSAVLLNQTYNRIFARLYNRFGKDWRTKLALDYTTRTDDHAGYSDYVKTSYLLQAKYDFSKRWELVADYKHWDRDYDNAYAFDVVTVTGGVPVTYVPEELSYSGDRVRLEVNGKLAKNREVSFSLRHDTVDATDDRYAYDRDILMATYTYTME